MFNHSNSITFQFFPPSVAVITPRLLLERDKVKINKKIWRSVDVVWWHIHTYISVTELLSYHDFFLNKGSVFLGNCVHAYTRAKFFLVIWHNCHSRACCVCQQYTDRSLWEETHSGFRMWKTTEEFTTRQGCENFTYKLFFPTVSSLQLME